eukprot:6186850-Pleurochrysis_carterae.AAC.3
MAVWANVPSPSDFASPVKKACALHVITTSLGLQLLIGAHALGAGILRPTLKAASAPSSSRASTPKTKFPAFVPASQQQLDAQCF